MLVPVLVVLGPVLLPLLVLGASLRTCLVTLSQHLTLDDVALDDGEVVVEVCATATPKLPVSRAAAINPIPAIRIRDSFLMMVVASTRRNLGETATRISRS